MSAARAMTNVDALRRTVEQALPVAKARAQMVEEIRTALEQGEERTAIALMRRYCGLQPVKALTQ